jgi:pyruvate dehydrogenase E1 component alpha subunit
LSGRPGDNGLTVERLLPLHRVMQRIRLMETRLSTLFADGEVPGFIHLSIGQEAVAAGVVGALGPKDTLATTHRGHGHVLARGVALDAFCKEILGKAGGICGGRGGSMHVADLSLGLLGANGIVGAGMPLATGSALAHKVRGTGGIAACFFGDGAMAEGALHECLNMAALWQLPALFVCENNGWSEFSPTSRQFAGTLTGLAAAFGLWRLEADGNDLSAVALAAEEAVARVRAGRPGVLECVTTRVRGHFEGDSQPYRAAGELDAMAANDPLVRSAVRLRELGVAEAELKAIAEEEAAAVEAAVEAARADAAPDFAAALADVYTPAAAGAAL